MRTEKREAKWYQFCISRVGIKKKSASTEHRRRVNEEYKGAQEGDRRRITSWATAVTKSSDRRSKPKRRALEMQVATVPKYVIAAPKFAKP